MRRHNPVILVLGKWKQGGLRVGQPGLHGYILSQEKWKEKHFPELLFLGNCIHQLRSTFHALTLLATPKTLGGGYFVLFWVLFWYKGSCVDQADLKLSEVQLPSTPISTCPVIRTQEHRLQVQSTSTSSLLGSEMKISLGLVWQALSPTAPVPHCALKTFSWKRPNLFFVFNGGKVNPERTESCFLTVRPGIYQLLV